jgi:hypothetical protein
LNLSDNGELKKAKFLFKKSLRGPDSIVCVNNKLYTGLLNGSLMEIDVESSKLRKIAQIGKLDDESCSKFNIYW